LVIKKAAASNVDWNNPEESTARKSRKVDFAKVKDYNVVLYLKIY
jgi:hypothetical protein